MEQSASFLKSIKENWILIAFIGGLIISWNNFSNRLNVTENAQIEQRQDIKALMITTQELQTAVIENKANFIFIKESISELKRGK